MILLYTLKLPNC